MAETITIRTLGPDDAEVLERVRPGVFGGQVDPVHAWAFLSVGANVIVVALARGEVVGVASGTVLLRPDRPRSFFLSEWAVHAQLRGQGIEKRLLTRVGEVARERGCAEIWGLTQADNAAARGLAQGMDADEVAERILVRRSLDPH